MISGFLDYQKTNIPDLHTRIMAESGTKKKEKEEESTEENESKTEDDQKSRNVSIKGVSKDLYKRVNEIAHETGKTMGEITNEAYRAFASTIDGAKTVSKNFISGAMEGSAQVIANLKELDISGKEMKDFKKKLLFRNIKKLTLKDVTDEDIVQKVHSFVHIDELVVPGTVKKATILTRCTFVSKITQK